MRLVPSERVERIAAQALFDAWLDAGREPFATAGAIAEHRRQFRAEMEDRARSEGREWAITAWFSVLEEAFDITDITDLARDAELIAERLATKAAPGVSEVLSRLRARASGIIAISDTWLTEPMLTELLDTHGISVDQVFTSASRAASKRNGEIFAIIERELGATPEHFVHIGDNIKSDYIRPVGRRWRSIWIPDIEHAPKPGPYLALSTRSANWRDVWRAASVPIDNGQGPSKEYRFGRDLVAPALLINAVWQARLMNSRQVESAMFIAREGRLLADVFDALRPELNNPPEPVYARLSRRSVLFASARNPLVTGRALPGKTRPATVVEHLTSIGTPPKLRSELLDAAGLADDSRWTTDAERALGNAATRLEGRIAAARRAYVQKLLDYTHDLIGGSASGHIAIVDSGWAGTIQDVLQEILPPQTALTGIYLGVSTDGETPTPRNAKLGLIRDDYRPRHPGHPGFEMAGAIRALELLLAELTEGTAMALERDAAGRVVVDVGQPPLQHLPPWLSQLRSGILAGITGRRDAAELLYRVDDLFALGDLEAAACVGMRTLLLTPPRTFARRLLSMTSEEGAAPGRTKSLDIDGISSGSAWFPGIAAKYGLGCLNPAIETMISAYDAFVRSSS
ncbi:MAG: HAD family hydrolase [Myxococcota bacterium]